MAALARARARSAAATTPADPADAAEPSTTRSTVDIPAGEAVLQGFLDVPGSVRGVVVFVHGSGSSRHSRRNQAVARALTDHGFATLLFDLLTDAESTDRRHVFDIALLTRRLQSAIAWVTSRPELADAPIGLFGASTGAAAALQAAAAPDSTVRTVVSRGGRPDLAAEALALVRCPVLLLVGGDDLPTIHANEAAAARLRAPYRMQIVPGATHLFEEPGALEQVARLATVWFEHFLGSAAVADATASGDRN